MVFPRYITCQGVALNVTTDLSPFEMIVACGIKGCRMGSIKEILQKASDGRGIDETSLMDQAYNSLIQEFAEVFKLSLDHSPNWSLQQSNDFNKLNSVLLDFCRSQKSVQVDNRDKNYL